MANLVGLDIGTRSLKATALSKGKNGYALTGLAYQELPFPEEEIPHEEIVRDALKKFIKEGGLKMKDVAISLSNEFAQVRSVEMPKMGAEELRNVLPYEIEQYLPINPDESVIDFQIQGDVKNDNTKMNVILAAGVLEAADSAYKMVSGARLNCRAIDADELALMNMFEVNYAWEEDYQKIVCLLHIGNRMTSVVIFDEGQFRFNKTISITGETLTKDIQRDFALKMEQAEDLKREQAKVVVEDASSFSLSMFDQEDRTLRIHETISSSLNKMLTDIKRCFEFYETQSKGRSVERILLSGGGARLNGLDKFLADKFGLTVEFANPFRQVQVPTKGPFEALIESNATAFGVSMGLALRKFS